MPTAEWLKANTEAFQPGVDASEMSWGDGPTPPGLEDASPSQGGVYRGKTPAIDAATGDGLRALAAELDERRSRGDAVPTGEDR
ncbi:hypothetical protein [Gordonia polyisoprenivorans]|uniref:hypothetical protein n=1 Tax=Gordonia polyisoprenivorans TaxID=84595 RepID=UPI00030A4604|nr:hypothetical protein [Gordonia polyisoprenivorans]